MADSYVSSLRTAQKSPRHIRNTEGRLKRFNVSYGDWLACDVSTDVIDDFLTNLKEAVIASEKATKSRPLSATSKNNYRVTLNGMFNHAVKLKAATVNPVADAVIMKTVSTEPGTLKPAELNALLIAADDDTRAGIAISFFAGLRRAEIEGLDWSDINLEENHIVVSAAIAKKNTRRIVNVSDNLRAWLLPLQMPRGKVMLSPQIWRNGFEKARELAGIKVWPQNAGRHSFASYHLAKHQDAGKTSFELGHRGGSRLLYEKYAKAVTKKAADAYWKITPPNKSKITRINIA